MQNHSHYNKEKAFPCQHPVFKLANIIQPARYHWPQRHRAQLIGCKRTLQARVSSTLMDHNRQNVSEMLMELLVSHWHEMNPVKKGTEQSTLHNVRLQMAF